MAHTCGRCYYDKRLIMAPTLDERFEKLGRRLKINSKYHHDAKCWKRTTRARRQYLARLASHPPLAVG